MEFSVGVIGAGGMGSRHVRHWSRVPGVKVTAIADLFDLAKAEQLAASIEAQAFSSAETLLASGCDVVSICTPTDSHRILAEQALAAGCHVLCEKPMALTLEDCDAMVVAAEKAGKLLSVGQVVRFFPEYANAKRMVDSGAVGKPAAVRARRGGGFPGWSEWFADVNRTGGIIFDLAVHEFDWLLWCFGPVIRVYAKAITGRYEKCDLALITLRHASGCVSHVEAIWADPQGGGTRFEIAGDGGLLSHDARLSSSLSYRTETHQGGTSPLHTDDDPYYKQCLAFARAVRGEAPLVVTAKDGRAAIAVAAAASESLKTGRAISVEV
ncbi:MAG: Gfo/Idh/MocA family oxidoreductase [Armatimonas sp.]